MYIVSIAAGTHPYVNDPIDTTKRYEDYVLEIIDLVDRSFNTFTDKENRGIGGISMGGGGALYIAARHSDMFNSASALSAGRINTVLSVADGLRGVKVMFDCGQQDQLLNDNRQLHDYLVQLGIPHIYNEYPGQHNWSYWAAHYWDHLSFHAYYFSR